MLNIKNSLTNKSRHPIKHVLFSPTLVRNCIYRIKCGCVSLINAVLPWFSSCPLTELQGADTQTNHIFSDLRHLGNKVKGSEISLGRRCLNSVLRLTKQLIQHLHKSRTLLNRRGFVYITQYRSSLD